MGINSTPTKNYGEIATQLVALINQELEEARDDINHAAVAEHIILNRIFACLMRNNFEHERIIQLSKMCDRGPLSERVKKSRVPMSEAQAKRFSFRRIPWKNSIHFGEQVSDLDHEYLVYLVEQEDEFVVDLARYLETDFYKRNLDTIERYEHEED